MKRFNNYPGRLRKLLPLLAQWARFRAAIARSRPARSNTVIACWLLTLGLLGAQRAWGGVEVNVTRVGFAVLGGGDVIRQSAWAPVIVDLALIDQQPSFDGTLRVGQIDLDGDECYDRVEIHLRAETGGTQRVHLFALPNIRSANRRIFVEVFDVAGQAVQVVSQGERSLRAFPAEQPEAIADNDLLILELSTGTVGRVKDLVDGDQRDAYERVIHVAHASPGDLSEHWLGLESVDYIIWEDADPANLSERQLSALVEWTRQGGTLLVAASRTAAALSQTQAIKDVLPATIGGVTSAALLPATRLRLLDDGDEERYDPPAPVVHATARKGSTVIVHEKSIGSDLVTRRSLGRGFVVFSAVTLRDLLAPPGEAYRLFRKLFHLTAREDVGENEVRGERPLARPVYRNVISAVSFATSGTVYLLIAGAFSAVYVLLATFGAWTFLGRRTWLHHSWTAFAAVAAVASFLSILAVRSIHGFGERVHQLSVIDAAAGESFGQGVVLIGLKTSTDKRLDVWLPSDPLSESEPGPTSCFLRPLMVGEDPLEGTTSFADPEDYRLAPASAVVDDVRIRSTLKQFEGRWSGPLGGQLTAQITFAEFEGEGRGGAWDYRVTDDSYVVNSLGVDLKSCYLLHGVNDLLPEEGQVALRADRYRNDEIVAYAIGDFSSDSKKIALAPRCYPQSDPAKVYDECIAKRRLKDVQRTWSGPFHDVFRRVGSGLSGDAGFALGNEESALLLMSTIGEYDHRHDSGMRDQVFGSTTFGRDRLRSLDLREHIGRNQAVLIGFADHAGPVKLFRRDGERPYTAITPDANQSRTMYRIRIPVTVIKSERPSRGDDRT